MDGLDAAGDFLTPRTALCATLWPSRLFLHADRPLSAVAAVQGAWPRLAKDGHQPPESGVVRHMLP